MKKFITSIFCLIGTILFAQEKSNTIKEEGKLPNWGILLSKLDTTQIKLEVLIDSS